jgi:hypothetical protein
MYASGDTSFFQFQNDFRRKPCLRASKKLRWRMVCLSEMGIAKPSSPERGNCTNARTVH